MESQCHYGNLKVSEEHLVPESIHFRSPETFTLSLLIHFRELHTSALHLHKGGITALPQEGNITDTIKVLADNTKQ